MTKRPITLVCEKCSEEFEARARRRVVHCRKCAEDLRTKDEGPVQMQRRISANSPYDGNIQAKEIPWTRAEDNLAYYLDRFRRFPAYDGAVPSELHRITDEDRHLANKIGARVSAKTWAAVIGDPIAQIGDWDLLNMTDLEWQSRKEVIREVLNTFLGRKGIGVARLTKALHRKRPKLIPICDSVILEALGVKSGTKAGRIIDCMDRFRIIGREELSRLKGLRQASERLHCGMTELRILEILYWVEFGPFRVDAQGI